MRMNSIGLVVNLMTDAEGGPHMQSFVIEALRQYAQSVTSSPCLWTPSYIDESLWADLAAEVNVAITEWLDENGLQ